MKVISFMTKAVLAEQLESVRYNPASFRLLVFLCQAGGLNLNRSLNCHMVIYAACLAHSRQLLCCFQWLACTHLNRNAPPYPLSQFVPPTISCKTTAHLPITEI